MPPLSITSETKIPNVNKVYCTLFLMQHSERINLKPHSWACSHGNIVNPKRKAVIYMICRLQAGLNQFYYIVLEKLWQELMDTMHLAINWQKISALKRTVEKWIMLQDWFEMFQADQGCCSLLNYHLVQRLFDIVYIVWLDYHLY